MTPPPSRSGLRWAIAYLIANAFDPAVLLAAADALDEAARELGLLGQPHPDLPDLAAAARSRAASMWPTLKDTP